MIIKNVMTEIGDRAGTVRPLRVHPYEADEITVPACLVSLPGLINYQTTYGPGFVSLTLEVTVLVSRVDDRIRLDEIAPYGDSTGERSIRRVLETGTYTAFDALTVMSSRFQIVEIAGDSYLACIFTVEVIGSGRN